MKTLSTVLVLPNGYEVSIQHSDHHYCSNTSVEVAVIYKGEFAKGYPHYTTSGVAPHVYAPQLIEIINWAKAQKGEPPTMEEMRKVHKT